MKYIGFPHTTLDSHSDSSSSRTWYSNEIKIKEGKKRQKKEDSWKGFGEKVDYRKID